MSNVSGKVVDGEVGMLGRHTVGACVKWNGTEAGWVNIEGGIGVSCLPVLADGFGDILSTGVNGEAAWLEGAGDEGATHGEPCLPK